MKDYLIFTAIKNVYLNFTEIKKGAEIKVYEITMPVYQTAILKFTDEFGYYHSMKSNKFRECFEFKKSLRGEHE